MDGTSDYASHEPVSSACEPGLQPRSSGFAYATCCTSSGRTISGWGHTGWISARPSRSRSDTQRSQVARCAGEVLSGEHISDHGTPSSTSRDCSFRCLRSRQLVSQIRKINAKQHPVVSASSCLNGSTARHGFATTSCTARRRTAGSCLGLWRYWAT